ncbi:MAG TPA: hypothetical protein VM840_09245 [Actinomycetota bacterium]|nr:hypothetical protein [Actinomycetota bacterium]
MPTLPVVHQERNVPEGMQTLVGFTPDYFDVFTIHTDMARERTPEQWARALVEHAAGPAGQFVWRVVLGLRLDTSPESVGGWRVGGRGDDWIRLEASSWCLTANVTLLLSDDRLSVGTFGRYDRAVAERVWQPLSVVHRRAMPGLLLLAAKRVGAEAAAA